MFVTNSKGRTLLDKAIEKAEVKFDGAFYNVLLKGGFVLSFTESEWKAITRK